ncbi:MAG: glycosyltransferase, partial [Thermoplasmata archaeon]
MTRPLRILVATPLPASVTGGIEEYAHSVIETLRAGGAEVTVLTTRYGKLPAPTPGAPPGRALEAKELLGRPVCIHPTAYLRIFRFVQRADVVHIHMPFPFVEAVVAGLAKLMGKPVVVTYHMDAVVESADGSLPKPLHRLAEFLYRALSAVPTVDLADRVCTNTRAYALQSPVLRDRMERLLVVHQGIDSKKFAELSTDTAQEVRRQLLGEQHRRLVSFVGRLVPYKGLDVLIEAVRSLDRPDTLFVIGGRGPEEVRIRRAVADHHLSNVRLLGFVPDQQLMNLFCASDLVVSPSVSSLESTPITLLYARAAGTPVIGTDVGGTGECIPDDGLSGLVVPAGDVPALTSAIRRLLEAPPTRIREVAPRFWSDVAGEYRDLM